MRQALSLEKLQESPVDSEEDDVDEIYQNLYAARMRYVPSNSGNMQ